MDKQEFESRVLIQDRARLLKHYEPQIEVAGRTLARLFCELYAEKSKPYLLNHDSWDDYCIDRWNMTPRRVRQIMTGETVRAQLCDAPETADIAPKLNEGQLREIAQAEPHKRVALVAAAKKEDPKMPARAIKAARVKMIDAATGQPEEPADICPTCNQEIRKPSF